MKQTKRIKVSFKVNLSTNDAEISQDPTWLPRKETVRHKTLNGNVYSEGYIYVLTSVTPDLHKNIDLRQDNIDQASIDMDETPGSQIFLCSCFDSDEYKLCSLSFT